jgi:ring-1,2-phenylacetyl-CoA epoxidase subunit PaaD
MCLVRGPNNIAYMQAINELTEENLRRILEGVADPEVPALSVMDLGIIREVHVQDGAADIVITPTYSGCPAMDMIRMQIRLVLAEQGYAPVHITTVLSPAWTTDWMSEKGKQKLLAYGIAPPTPVQQVCTPKLFQREEAIACPRCNSYNTRMVSEFGSTACKALYRCEDCREPFDYFKCH